MNQEKRDRLYREFPTLFTKDLWELEVGDGWFGIIHHLAKKIVEKDTNCRVLQVKEKFGGLRFYIGAASAEVHEFVRDAEAQSYKVCERCGSQEGVTQTDGGWMKTTCTKCLEEENNT